jgi:hypothetical protein
VNTFNRDYLVEDEQEAQVLPFGPRLVLPIAVVLIGVGSFSLLH